MKPPAARCETTGTGREALEVEMLVSDDKRRLEIATGSAKPIHADIDDELRELIDPPNKRSERETSRVLKILDELERGQG